MPIDLNAPGGYRAEGLCAALIAEQQAAVVKIDPRQLDWQRIEGPEELTADKARLEAKMKANPRRSPLLEKLHAGEPVVVGLRTIRRYLSPGAPDWLADPWSGPEYVQVHADDRIEPADWPPTARAY